MKSQPQAVLKFTKMHGLGNDFAIIDAISQYVLIDKSYIKKLANRHCGIGFDQLLLIGPSEKADFSCRIFNADGSEAEQCGNGMRCIARFIHEKKLSAKKILSIATKTNIIEVSINDFDNIKVNMGIPEIDSPCHLQVEQSNLTLFKISLGNPHTILPVKSVRDFPVSELGPKISTHPFFPEGTNVGFMEIVNRRQIHLRTYERGSGETLACGSNACAAVIAGIANNLLDHQVTVELSLGNLLIEWQGNDHPVFMSGPAEKVFEGTI